MESRISDIEFTIEAEEKVLDDLEKKKEYIKTDREYKAYLKERAKKEDTILKLAYEVDSLKEELENLKKSLLKKRKEYEEKIGELEEEMEDIEYEKKYAIGKISKIEEEIETLKKKLSSETLNFYDRYKEHYEGKVVAFIDDGACSVCSMTIPGKIYSEIIKGKEGKCPNCGRWIFYIEEG